MWILLAPAPARADDVRLVLHDPRRVTAPGDRCDAEICTSLLALVERAHTSVGFAFYGFRSQTALLGAFEAARARGVQLTGVVDRDVAGGNPYADTDRWVAALGDVRSDLEADRASAADHPTWLRTSSKCPRPEGTAGPLQCVALDLGDRCWLGALASRDPIRFEGDILHDKFVVTDHRYVWTGSANASDSCTGGYNANFAVVVDAPVVAGWYESELAQMYAGRYHRAKQAQGPMRAVLGDDLSIEVLFSPQHHAIDAGVVPLVAGAQRSIDVAVFFLTHTDLAQALIDAHRRGVRVRVLLDATGAANEYSKHDALRAAGIPVKVEDFGGKMHAKSAVIDGRIVIGGSMNWTKAGTDENDENTVILRSVHLADQYRTWFDGLWAGVPDRWLTGRPDPESRDSGAACADGADNDFDGRVDRDDPGCGAVPPTPPPQAATVVPKVGATCRWPS
jgi:phosphatidylserine/phosphatidylglycerophosphate/cardiolipin synthase-like enzyme